MKTLKLLSGFTLVAMLFTSCYTEVIIDDEPSISLNQLLNTHELWYVDINQTVGTGETTFLQIAFTISFKNGTLYANNNLVGIGNQGNGFGIPVGSYGTSDMILDIDHDIDGFNTFDVYQIDSNTIELYNPNNDTSYFYMATSGVILISILYSMIIFTISYKNTKHGKKLILAKKVH